MLGFLLVCNTGHLTFLTKFIKRWWRSILIFLLTLLSNDWLILSRCVRGHRRRKCLLFNFKQHLNGILFKLWHRLLRFNLSLVSWLMIILIIIEQLFTFTASFLFYSIHIWVSRTFKVLRHVLNLFSS